MNIDYLNKEMVASYTLDNHNCYYNRTDLPDEAVGDGFMMSELRSAGRKFYKSGKFCVQTMSGVVYKTQDKKTKRTAYLLQCGVAKQNPTDLVHNKHEAAEVSLEHTFTEPVVSIILDHFPDFYEFRDYALPYLLNAKQQYVNTTEENDVAEMKSHCASPRCTL